ncbi:MAG TPA: metallophosphoesterase family protein [Mobilitalea sp.]|nr:metallophosphoesterase family protein [Mobilitalea sp.]
MKLAILSDIHSNHIALRACLDYALNIGVEHFLFLGDYISDCPYPQKTMEILYDMKQKYPCHFIRGNREDYMLNYHANGEKGWYYCSSCGSLIYTYENLTMKDLNFFDGLDIKGRIEIDGYPALSICHGSMTSSKELLFKDEPNTIEALQNLDTELLICGHTHEQGTFEYGNRKVVNPGSVGVPMDSYGKAQFVILHGNQGIWQEEYLQLPYDVKAELKEFKESGLDWKAPMWTVLIKHNLITGINLNNNVLKRAIEICEKETGEANWPDIPEKYWEQAVEEAGLTWNYN